MKLHAENPVQSSKNDSPGYSVVELAVVLAGLAILSSLAIPNYQKYLKSARVDEAKSLLNSAAADCLQSLRGKNDAEASNTLNSPVNPMSLSQARLDSVGYTANSLNCGNTFVTPTQSSDKAIMPDLSFIINKRADGTYYVAKGAQYQNNEAGRLAKSWAGAGAVEGEGVKELTDYMAKIAESREVCATNLANWLTTTGEGRSPYNSWNSSASIGCPTTPPLKESKTCTTNGCTLPTYALDNKIVGIGSNAEAAYKAAFTAKYDGLCAIEVENKRTNNDTTPPSKITTGEKVLHCGNKPFWFYEGENVGSENAWRTMKCKDNKKKLLSSTHSGPVEFCETSPIYICGGEEITGSNAKANFDTCLANDKNALCTTSLNEDAAKRSKGGPYTSPTPSGMSAPVGNDCNVKYWYCIDKIYRTEDTYKTDERCQIRDCGTPKYTSCNMRKFYNDNRCRAYSKCMGRI